MIWPFNKLRHKTQPVELGQSDDANGPFYVSRPRVEAPIADALAHNDNLVIYGPPHQGKTTLLNRQLNSGGAIYIECRPDFKRTQIYRVALSSLGYAVLVQKKRSGKASATVKFGIHGTGVETKAEGGIEQVMQAVSVDLRNPSEVAHLISRIDRMPWLVLNNFQLLDSGTRRRLLFDLTFFAERPNIRFVIVGSWPNEEYLEEIEPAVAGKFRYVNVPAWTDAELRLAMTQWSSNSTEIQAIAPRVDEYMTLAAGDISLFRASVDGSIARAGSAAGDTPASATMSIQAMVLGRFRRGLGARLKSIFAHRETYVTYYTLEATSSISLNPAFHQIPNAAANAYLTTNIDPSTNRPYTDGRTVLLDAESNPQYLEQVTGKVVLMQTDIGRYLLRTFHAVVQSGSTGMALADLVHSFAVQLDPKPIGLDETRLKSVFTRFDEVQREALIVPPMLAVNAQGDAMEVVDRRLFLYLQSVSSEDLEELLESVQPRTAPTARRRNRMSADMTPDEKTSYAAAAIGAPDEVPTSEEAEEEEPVEDGEGDSAVNEPDEPGDVDEEPETPDPAG